MSSKSSFQFLIVCVIISLTSANSFQTNKNFYGSSDSGYSRKSFSIANDVSNDYDDEDYDCDFGKCPDEWITFERETESWCVKLFHETLSHNEAEAKCKLLNATLTGLQNSEELYNLTETATGSSATWSGIWIGAQRRRECEGNFWTNSQCRLPFVFKWTDGHTTGVDGFRFAGLGNDAGFAPDKCMKIQMAKGYLHAHGAVRGSGCDKQAALDYYACGKEATYN